MKVIKPAYRRLKKKNEEEFLSSSQKFSTWQSGRSIFIPCSLTNSLGIHQPQLGDHKGIFALHIATRDLRDMTFSPLFASQVFLMFSFKEKKYANKL